MTLAQYLNQNPVEKQMHHSVLLEENDYDAYILSPDLLGIHIYKYPEYSYYLENKKGYIMALKDQKERLKSGFKSTVFKVDPEFIKQKFPIFNPQN